jgi:hypothetical protein
VHLTLLEIDLDNLQKCIDQAVPIRAWVRNSTGEPKFFLRMNFLPGMIRIRNSKFYIHGCLYSIENNNVIFIGAGEVDSKFGPGLGTINFVIPQKQREFLARLLVEMFIDQPA